MTLRQGQAKEARLNGARLPSAESLRRESVAESLEVLESPNDLFVPRDFQHLRVRFAGVAVSDDDVAIRKDVQLSDPRKLDVRHFVVVDLPNDLALG